MAAFVAYLVAITLFAHLMDALAWVIERVIYGS
jgi:hypothetical protein